jgi:hypothetical protein
VPDISPSDPPTQGRSQAFFTALGVAFLSPAIATWASGAAISDVHVYGPTIVAVGLFAAAFIPGPRARNLRARFAGIATNTWVWFGLFAGILLYFAAWTFFYRYEQLTHITQPAPEVRGQERSEWPLLTDADIRSLANKLTRIRGVTRVFLYYASPLDEPLVLDLAKAMNEAGWPQPTIQQYYAAFSLRIQVGGDLDPAAGTAIRDVLAKKTGEIVVLGNSGSAGWVVVAIGRKPGQE